MSLSKSWTLQVIMLSPVEGSLMESVKIILQLYFPILTFYFYYFYQYINFFYIALLKCHLMGNSYIIYVYF